MAARRRSGALAGGSAVQLRDRLANGALRAVDVAEAVIERIATSEPDVQAWAWHDPEFVRTQARALDAHRGTGRPLGALHGVPVGIKDVIDTARIPTENGTPLDQGRVPREDAFVVARLKAAGALIVGKTTTAELAYRHPARTTNPRAPGHTPGGSSSGSAAAVAAEHVPVTLGTQTGGSVIRPAAFCGTVGFKPSFGAIPRTGVLQQSPSLDTVGVLAGTVEDAALVAECLFGHDPKDRTTAPAAHPQLHRVATARPPVPPQFAFVRPPAWEQATAETRAALEELVGLLGEQCFEAPLPELFRGAETVRERIHVAEMAKCYFAYEGRGAERLSEATRAALDAGKAVPARDYIAALDWADVLYAGLGEIFERCDAILAPAALGPAPEGLASTGSAVFNGLWTLCGVPAVTLPLLETEDGLPMGVQMIGRRGDDARLLRSARWLVARLQDEGSEGASG
jgi:Asp-tRNA(Asn)/Glu-tRNA(Gln) amidotransferase A subunit family amidase